MSDKGKPKAPKMRRPSKRMGELVTYAAPLLLMDFTMIKKFAGVPVSDIRQSGGYRSLEENQRVEFEIAQGPKGLQAENIRPI